MLELTVFLCGALVMVLEMVGARVLAPHVGTSAIVWTSLIGVVLACLAAGAWAGGRYADRHLSPHGLAKALLGAAIGCALTAFFHNYLGTSITGLIGNLYAAAVVAAIAIFALPAFFFGIITPYVIRLRIASVDTAGATVGRLYALSTAGSIVGTFLGGFILISFFSSSSILWGLACAMLFLSLLNEKRKIIGRLALLALFVFLAFQDNQYEAWLADRGGSMNIDTIYNNIQIREGRDPTRNGARVMLMSTNPGYMQSGMLTDNPNELYFDYTRYYALGPALVPEAQSVLMLGGGGYSVPKWLLSNKTGLAHPDRLKIDVVELDPGMTAVAAKVFALPNDRRLSIYHEDARSFLNRQQKQYDLVFVDVFNSHYSIPFQMTTEEALAAMRRAVAPGGAVLINVISAIEGEDGKFFRALWQGLTKTFPNVRAFLVGDADHPDDVQNIMIVARPEMNNNQISLPENPDASPGAQEIVKMTDREYLKNIVADVPPLLDDYAPVERYALMLTRN